jgi:1-acyl-sn-glycerol-3-phosphate acyltransferase
LNAADRHAGSDESFGVRWKRRSVTMPAVLAMTAGAVLTAPLVVPLLCAMDLVSGRFRLPRLRVWAMAVQYLLNDSAEVLLAPAYWVMAGFGTRLNGSSSRKRHARLQLWSSGLLARRAEQLLGLRMEVDPGDQAWPTGPLIVLARHASVADAAVPGLVTAEAMSGIDTPVICGVLMSELLSDPGFDLVYHRLGSVFVDRTDGAQARARIRALAEDLTDGSAAVIFPEGRLFRPDRLQRSLDRLGESDPLRAERLSGLANVLPPRPGGVLELLEGAPGADVVIIEHRGFESVPAIADLCRRAPVEHPVQVRARLFTRPQIPMTARGRIEWLDQRWLEMDRWIAEGAGGAPGPDVDRLPVTDVPVTDVSATSWVR